MFYSIEYSILANQCEADRVPVTLVCMYGRAGTGAEHGVSFAVCMCLGIGPLLRDTIRARGGVKSDKTPRGFTHRSGKPSQGGRQARRAPQSRAVKLRTYTGRHGSCRLRGGCMIRGRAGHRPVAHARSSLRRGPGARGGERVLGYAGRGRHPPRLAARGLLRSSSPACPRRRLAGPEANSTEHRPQ